MIWIVIGVLVLLVIAAGERGDKADTGVRKNSSSGWSASQALQSVNETLDSANRSLDAFSARLEAKMKTDQIVHEALALPRHIFFQEKHAIEMALDVEIFRSRSELDRECYDEAYAKLSERREASKEKETWSVPAMIAPPQHPDPVMDEVIKQGYQDFLRDREQWFDGVRRQMRHNKNLPEMVKAHLTKQDCATCWKLIA